jgi:formylglycine-generating enzyme required for sulfatase activity
MSKYEVTYAEFDVYAEETGAAKPIDYYGWGRGNLPVMGVNWYEAVAYANWLSQKTGKVYRLPSEEEWEFAARAGTTTNYFWGDDIGVNNAACWNCGTSWDEKAAPVGSFKPNNFGLFDMHGNAWEWTQGCSDAACNFRVLRGGSWNNFPHSLRSITREFQAPISRLVSGGFRLVRDDSAQDNLYGVNFVNVSAGTFTMGLTKQKYYKSPAHTVLVPAFSMSKYAITFDQYDEFANATSRGLPSDNGWGRGNRPVINVSWYDAVAYTEWLSSKTGKKIRLPSDAEWEYAARAGTTTEYYWGDLVGVNNANCNGCGGVWNGSTGTSPVGTFAANPWGLFDMSGNVWQWTQDCDHSDYVGAPTDGSAWTSGGCGNRVYRGGSWDYPSVNMHLAYSNSYPPSVKTGFIGFRVVMEVSN